MRAQAGIVTNNCSVCTCDSDVTRWLQALRSGSHCNRRQTRLRRLCDNHWCHMTRHHWGKAGLLRAYRVPIKDNRLLQVAVMSTRGFEMIDLISFPPNHTIHFKVHSMYKLGQWITAFSSDADKAVRGFSPCWNWAAQCPLLASQRCRACFPCWGGLQGGV